MKDKHIEKPLKYGFLTMTPEKLHYLINHYGTAFKNISFMDDNSNFCFGFDILEELKEIDNPDIENWKISNPPSVHC